MWIYVYTFCRKFGKMSQIRVSRESSHIITILHRGGHWNLLQYYKGGGSSRFITILQRGGGGVSLDPKFVLRNIWTAPYWFVINQLATMLMFLKQLWKTTDWPNFSRSLPELSFFILWVCSSEGSLPVMEPNIAHIGRHQRLFENLQFPRLHNKEARRGTKEDGKDLH